MNTKLKLEGELLKAMRDKDDIRKSALRMALSSIKLAEVEQNKPLDESVILSILQKEIKTREETIQEARNANRFDMVTSLQAEIQVLKKFLPVEISDDELGKLIDGVIARLSAKSMKEMGVVMKNVIQEVAGRASNDRISKIVREKLSGT